MTTMHPCWNCKTPKTWIAEDPTQPAGFGFMVCPNGCEANPEGW